MNYKSILISGVPGAGKSTLAHELSRIIGWRVFYVGGIWREQWKAGAEHEQQTFEQYIKTRTVREHAAMDARARKELARGSCIGDLWHERIGDRLPLLKVFVDASLSLRARRAVVTKKYFGKKPHEIELILKSRERSQVNLAKKIYGATYDYRERSYYHLILNFDLLTAHEGACLLARALR